MVLFIALVNTTVYAQTTINKQVEFLVDTSITIMQNNAVNADKIDWPTVKQTALNEATTLTSPYQLGNVMRNLYKAIGDFHGAFFYRDSIFRWNGSNLVISDSVKKEWNKHSGIKTALLNYNIGYLRVPSMPGDSKATFSKKAQALNDSLCLLLTKNIQGLILDLRLDGGGAVHSMILGLEQLLGQGKMGSFQSKTKENWIIKDNKLLIDTAVMASIMPKSVTDASKIPVVLLVGSGTGSSGEFLVMAFKGRKKTILMGTQTAGYVTINNGFAIKNVAFMNLSIGYGTDRNDVLYTKFLTPDILLTHVDRFNNLNDDEKVIAAMMWLKKHSK